MESDNSRIPQLGDHTVGIKSGCAFPVAVIMGLYIIGFVLYWIGGIFFGY